MSIKAGAGTYVSVLGKDICINSVYISTPGLIKGRWYDNGLGLTPDSVLQVARPAHTLYAAPMSLEQRVQFDKIAIECTSNVDSDKSIRLGVYANANGLPGSLLVDSGTLNLKGNSVIEAPIDFAYDVNWVWLAFIHNGGGDVSFRSLDVKGGAGGLGFEDPSELEKSYYVYKSLKFSSVKTSLPKEFGDVYFAEEKPPRILLRVRE